MGGRRVTGPWDAGVADRMAGSRADRKKGGRAERPRKTLPICREGVGARAFVQGMGEGGGGTQLQPRSRQGSPLP